MNKIIKKLLLAGDTFMAELTPGNSGITNSVCGMFTEHWKTIEKFKKTGDFKHIF